MCSIVFGFLPNFQMMWFKNASGVFTVVRIIIIIILTLITTVPHVSGTPELPYFNSVVLLLWFGLNGWMFTALWLWLIDCTFSESLLLKTVFLWFLSSFMFSQEVLITYWAALLECVWTQSFSLWSKLNWFHHQLID